MFFHLYFFHRYIFQMRFMSGHKKCIHLMLGSLFIYFDMEKCMQSFKKMVLGASVFVAHMGLALAAPCGDGILGPCEIPEPSSLPLLGLGLVAAVVVTRFFKK